MWKWKLFCYLLRRFSKNQRTYETRLRRLLEQLRAESVHFETSWVTNWSYSKQPLREAALERSSAQVAIVMQGPLRLEDNFTLETVKHLRSTFPDSPLILSTWHGENEASLKAIEACGAVVVRSEVPGFPGQSNVNLQIASTKAGLKFASQYNLPYTLKMRTDTRVYAPRFIDYLMGLVDEFPIAEGLKPRGRIAVLDVATRLFIPNHPSDIMMFGYREDISTYWDVANSLHQGVAPHLMRGAVHGDLWTEHIPEVYLCEQYYNRIGYANDRSLRSWWQALADLFVVVDRRSIDHFWPKYSYVMEHRLRHDACLRTLAFCSFADWLNMRRGVFPPIASDEQIRKLEIDDLLVAA